MSHSKRRQQGKSYYLDTVNVKAKKYLVQCQLCGFQGYDPRIDSGVLTEIERNPHLKQEITRMYEPLDLDDRSLCESCSNSI